MKIIDRIQKKDLFMALLAMFVGAVFMKLEVTAVIVPVLLTIGIVGTIMQSKNKPFDWIMALSGLIGGLLIQLIDLIPVWWR